MSRRTLSFTSEQPWITTSGNTISGQTILENWSPPRMPLQINQWDKESAVAQTLADELILLHDSGPEACIDAITWAFQSKNWKPGGGAEHGFATAIARFAALGIASLSAGGGK